MSGLGRWVGYLMGLMGLALVLASIELVYPTLRVSESPPLAARPVLPPATAPEPVSNLSTCVADTLLPVSPTATVVETPTPFHAAVLAPTVLPEAAPLVLSDGTPTRIVIPAIGLDAPVEPVGWHIETLDGQSVSVWDVPDHFAAGWLKTTAPVGMGNTVLEGHHNINGEVFRNLINLKAGDTIKVYTLNTAQEYKVIESILVEEEGQPFEVRRANARYIQPTADIRLTLVTCWPYTGNSHRVIIVAAPDPS